MYFCQVILETGNPTLACQPANQEDATKLGAPETDDDDTDNEASRLTNPHCVRGPADTAATRIAVGSRMCMVVKATQRGQRIGK